MAAAKQHLISAAERGYSLWFGYRPRDNEQNAKQNPVHAGEFCQIEDWARETGKNCGIDMGYDNMTSLLKLLIADKEGRKEDGNAEDPASFARRCAAFSATVHFLSVTTLNEFRPQGIIRPTNFRELSSAADEISEVFYSVIKNEGAAKIPVTQLAALVNSLLWPLLRRGVDPDPGAA